MDQRTSIEHDLVQTALCRHGVFAFWPHDEFIGRSLEYYGEYSEQEVDLFTKLLRPGHVVIEVGSNIGAHTVPIARLVGDAGRVFAFEPQRLLFQQLCTNVALNNLWNVFAYPKAVGGFRGEIGVPPINYLEPQNFGGVQLTAKSPEMVEMIILDDLQIVPHFIKIDVEGMELEVLLGAQQMITRYRPAIYLENDRPGQTAALIQKLLEHDYDMWWHLPWMFNADNFRDKKDNIFATYVSVNMLCFPAELKLNVQGLRKVTGPEDTSGVTYGRGQ